MSDYERRPALISGNDCRTGTHPFETPPRRPNDDRLHLKLLLAALRGPKIKEREAAC